MVKNGKGMGNRMVKWIAIAAIVLVGGVVVMRKVILRSVNFMVKE
jgi:hypothetical protein